ncbi:MAG: amidohydrolase family protein [Acidobacteria bacterium]|nr:amidohydrolase family protein [Acidobacteriota bacterium]
MRLVLALWLVTSAGQDAPAQSLVLIHATVIDGTGAPPRQNVTVVIEGDRIRRITGPGPAAIPKSVQTVDAAGQFLIPGLWDMHVHTLRRGRPEAFLSLFVANGVTGVRDMGGDLLDQLPQLREEIAKGKLIGPRIVAPGPVLDGPQPLSSSSIAVSNDEEARSAVVSLKRRGADFIKVYSLLPREAYFAIADEAKKRAIPFSGHVPYSVSTAEASDAGQKSVEHLSGALLACSGVEAELRRELEAAVSGSDTAMPLPALINAQTKRVLETFSDQKAEALISRLAASGTWQCPTLVVQRAFAFLDRAGFTDDERLKYIPFSMRHRWNPAGHLRAAGGAADDFANRRRAFQKEMELVGRMRRAGVAFLAGSDAPTPYVFPGFSLHDELALLVQAGLTPMEALQAATRDPARYLGLSVSGTVEPGKIADLVLLEADPLKDIRNTRKIAAVVLGGKLIGKSSLQEMLAASAAFAARN